MAYKREQIEKDDDTDWHITLRSAVFISYVTAVLDMTIIFRNRMVRVATGGDLELGNLLELVGKYMEVNSEEITSRTAARIVLSAFEEDDEEAEEGEMSSWIQLSNRRPRRRFIWFVSTAGQKPIHHHPLREHAQVVRQNTTSG